MKIALVSDFMSETNYFPIWYNYYKKTFLEENIFLFSYQKSNIPNTKVIKIKYEDFLRNKIITNKITELLKSYDIVVHVDIDEFLIPENGTLREYLNSLTDDYVTAMGFDVFHHDEPDLNLKLPILQQRKFMYANTHYNKTCITKIPLKWSLGFHFCNHPPKFNKLFLLHLKHADKKIEQEWNDFMSISSLLKSYYAFRNLNRENLPIDTDINRKLLNEEFLSKVFFCENYGDSYKTYASCIKKEAVNIIIPEDFKLLI